jgi:RND family efflux transporter MFP subunit
MNAFRLNLALGFAGAFSYRHTSLSPNMTPRSAIARILFAVIASNLIDAAHAQVKSPVGKIGAHESSALEGILRPILDSEVATSESGIVMEILVSKGARVTRGQPIARLESAQMEAALAVFLAEATATGLLEATANDVKLKGLIRDRTVELFGKGNASPLEKERAQIDFEIAQSRLTAERERQKGLQLQYERHKRQLDDRTILAPADGIVIQVLKEVGEFVASNSPSIVRLVDISRLKAEIYVQESGLTYLQLQSKVRLKLSDGRTVPGTVHHIPPLADPESGMFLVEIMVENADESINGSWCNLLLE